MELKEIETIINETQHFDSIDELIIVFPDCLNLIFLLIFICGMYYGIEIHHPLYAVLFLNVIVVLILSLINITIYIVLPIGLFMQFSKLNGGIFLIFQCTSWCLTSVIRYVYIVHGDWIDGVIPDPRCQCLGAFAISIATSIAVFSPILGYLIYIGKPAFTIITLSLITNFHIVHSNKFILRLFSDKSF
jgi:hypothetical protein